MWTYDDVHVEPGQVLQGEDTEGLLTQTLPSQELIITHFGTVGGQVECRGGFAVCNGNPPSKYATGLLLHQNEYNFSPGCNVTF